MPTSQGGVADIERVVETYSDMLLRVALHYTQNHSDAEDMVQTVFLKLLKTAPAFASTEHEKAWLIRVTANQCKDLLRSAWKRKTRALEDMYAAPEEKGLEVLSAVRKLPEKYRDTIYLYYYEGYSTAEIAGMLGVAPGTIESRLHRARARLRGLMEGERDT
jgi:RNA polymerase sigma-70 factor (ECF subfamily)